MGEWYDYNIRFKDNGPDITETLIKDGYAAPLEDNDRLGLNIAKIDEAIKNHPVTKKWRISDDIKDRFLGNYYRNRDDKPFDIIHIGKGGSSHPDSIFYVNKWSPNLAIAEAISALYPERLVEAIETAPYFDRDTVSYMKNGDWANKEGEKLAAGLWGINPKLIKEPKDGMVRYRFLSETKTIGGDRLQRPLRIYPAINIPMVLWKTIRYFLQKRQSGFLLRTV